MTDTDTTPIWQRQPTTWKIADVFAEQWLEDDLLGLSIDDVPVDYAPGATRNLRDLPLTVCVFATLDGFHVNAYGKQTGFFGPDLLPLSDRGLGLTVLNRMHPIDPGWADDIRPRLAAAVRVAGLAVAAHRDGNVCGDVGKVMNGTNELTLDCQLPAGHERLDVEAWDVHRHGNPWSWAVTA